MIDQPTQREMRKPDFPAVVHTYTDALRLLREGPLDTAALAERTERDRSNMRRDMSKLVSAGVIDAHGGGTFSLTDKGRAWVAGQDVAEGLAPPPATGDTPDTLPEGLLTLRHDQILPDPDNARQDWTSDEAKDELDALRADIVQNGLLQNLVVRPMADDDLQDAFIEVTTLSGVAWLPRYRLVAGERRWRAIGEAINDGDWEDDQPILARLLDRDARETRFAAIAENLLRRKLNPIEKAKGFEQLAELGFENKLIAERLGYTPEHVQQHRRFLKLDEADQQRMTLSRDDPRHLSVRDARQKLTAKDKEAAQPEIPADLRLALAEMSHAAQKRASYSWGDFVVQADGHSSDLGRQLAQMDYARFSASPREYGADEVLGFYVVSRGHSIPSGLFPWAWTDDEGRLSEGLREEQSRAGHVDVEGYVTAWLNGPFALTPEGEAVLAKLKAEEDEREAREAANIAEREAAVARQRAMADLARQMFDARRAAPPSERAPDAFVTVATEAEASLPWRLTANGSVMAANGEIIIGGGASDRGTARMRLVVIGVNEAAGLETPDDEPAEEPEAEQDINGDDPSADEQDLEDQTATGPTRHEPGNPAVAIEDSVDPDFIVCLEDGRKFKSLKRHLRTKYDLSPEEYRARWGLDADYPMVAANYQAAREALARQMGASADPSGQDDDNAQDDAA